jgi:GNAT superfamily N-acetyltransferase
VLYQPLPRAPASPNDSGIRVVIAGPEEMPAWGAVSQQGWSDYPEVADYVLNIGPVIAAREDGASFLATLDGRPVAAGALCLGEGVAVLAGACTVPEARRRGAQQALLDARLAYAADHGCDIASIVAGPGSSSQRNAQRQGFQVAYTRTKWRLSRPQSG